MAIKELEKTLNADIKIEKTEVSFFKSWPNIHVSLKELTVDPKGDTLSQDLLTVANADFTLDILSFLGSDYKVKSIRLNRPELFLYANESGDWNFDPILQQDSSQVKKESNIQLHLKHVSTRKGRISMIAEDTGLKMSLSDLALGLKGDFYGDFSVIKAKASCFVDRISQDGIDYFGEKKIALQSVFSFQKKGEKKTEYKIREAELGVEALLLGIQGRLTQTGPQLACNLSFKTNNNSFESFLSLLPGGLLDTGNEYKYAGDFQLSGTAAGRIGGGHYPDVNFGYHVRNGSFQYVGYKSKLEEVEVDGSFKLSAEDLTQSYLIAEKIEAKLVENKLSGNFALKDFSQSKMEFEVKGELALNDLQEFYPSFADSSDLTGKVEVDIRSRGKVADYKGDQLNKVQTEGWLVLNKVGIEDPRVKHPVEGLTGRMEFNNNWINVVSLAGTAADTDFRLNGKVNSYWPYLLDSTAYLVADFNYNSSNTDLNDWMEATDQPAIEVAKTEYYIELPKRMSVSLTAHADALEVGTLSATEVNGKVRWKDNRIVVSQLDLKSMKGAATLNGEFNVVSPEKVTVDLHVVGNDLDVNEALKNFRQWADFTTMEDHLYGTAKGNIDISGAIDKYLEFDMKSLVSEGEVWLANGKMIDYKPLEAMAGFVKMEKLKHVEFSDIHTRFYIKDGFMHIPRMKLSANDYILEVEGKHGFDNSLDYKVVVEMPPLIARKSRSKKIHEYVVEQEAKKLPIRIPLTIRGTVDNPIIGYDGNFAVNKVQEGLKQEKQELKEAGEKEIEELFGEQDTSDVEDWIIEEEKKPLFNRKKEKPDSSESLKDKLKDKWKEKNPFKRKAVLN